MSYVIAAPEYLAAAASDLSNIGSALTDANSAALGPTSSVFAAGADEVSTAISVLFNAHAQAYQALSEAAQAFHTQFVQLMSGGAQQYVLTEAANASPLQVLQGLVSESTASSQVLTTSQPVASSAASVASAGAAVSGLSAGGHGRRCDGWFGAGRFGSTAGDDGGAGVGSAVGAHSGRRAGCNRASGTDRVVATGTGRHGASVAVGGIASHVDIGSAGVGDDVSCNRGGRVGVFSVVCDTPCAPERHIGGGGAERCTSSGGWAGGHEQRASGGDIRVNGTGRVIELHTTNSAARCPSITIVACGPRLGTTGRTEPSITQRLSIPRTRHALIDDGFRVAIDTHRGTATQVLRRGPHGWSDMRCRTA